MIGLIKILIGWHSVVDLIIDSMALFQNLEGYLASRTKWNLIRE